MSTRSDGSISIDGRALTDEELRAAFRKLAETGMPVDLSIHEPAEPNRASFLAAKRISEILRDSGVKKWSIYIVDAPRKK